MKTRRYFFIFIVTMTFTAFLLSDVYAVNMIQNPSFENYNATTLIPDNWHLGEGAVGVMSEPDVPAPDGSVYVGNLGGEIVEDPQGGNPVNNENPPLTGKLYQVIDLSTLENWENGNWIHLTMSMFYRKLNANAVKMWVEYLPSNYNNSDITWDDPAWNGDEVHRTVFSVVGWDNASDNFPWRHAEVGKDLWIPCVRWIRVCLYFDASCKYTNRMGPYLVGVDNVSLEAEVLIPLADDPDNLLLNPGFEDYDEETLIPRHWTVLEGSVTSMWDENVRPYKGNRFAGLIGGYTTKNPDPAGYPIDHPNPTMTGTIAQVIDLSTLEDWENANFIKFSFSGHYTIYGTEKPLEIVAEYLPETYNNREISAEDPAWSSEDVVTLIDLTDFYYNLISARSGAFRTFTVERGDMAKVRWIRIRIVLKAKYNKFSYIIGNYITGVDELCFKARAINARNLVKNPGFEEHDENFQPYNWHVGKGYVCLAFEPIPSYEGSFHAGNLGVGSGKPYTGTIYQVLDLSKAPYWDAVSPDGRHEEFIHVQFELSAYIANIGGTSVAIGLDVLPYNFNKVDSISWDDPEWETRALRVENGQIVNDGGSSYDLGLLIKDNTVSVDPLWRKVIYKGWLPRFRWIRLRIEFDATPTGTGYSCLGVDQVSFKAILRRNGPYSGYGPKHEFYNDANTIDAGIPGWVGPEGEGKCGGYVGRSKLNYVNPAFAGFADDYVNYRPSGQEMASCWTNSGPNIIGRPFTDAAWENAVVVLGDMDADMLADYFSDNPSGNYHPGEITAVFNKSPIINGPGPDFACFENGFVMGWDTPKIWAELAYVEVSSNGVDFIRMPCHSLTPAQVGGYGCLIASSIFGLVGKHVNAYGDSWGTPFDLDWIADHPLVLDGTVDLNNIRYVKMVDIPGGGPFGPMFYDSYGLPIIDAWLTWGSGGADLDAVGVLNSSAPDTDGDHITDYWDNCPQTKNPKQFDTDNDGYGNMCDCDIDGDEGGDGIVDVADYMVFRAAYGSHGPELISGEPGQPETYTDPSENWNPDADFNGDNVVNAADFAIFRSRYGSNAPFH